MRHVIAICNICLRFLSYLLMRYPKSDLRSDLVEAHTLTFSGVLRLGYTNGSGGSDTGRPRPTVFQKNGLED